MITLRKFYEAADFLLLKIKTGGESPLLNEI